MSLSEVSMTKNIWQQTMWKLKAYSSAFITVFMMQLLFAFFTIQGTINSSLGGMYVNMQISIYTMDSIVTFSLLASFIVSILMANKAAMHENVSVVTTRTTATLSTIVFLLMLSAVATLMVVSTFYITILIVQQMNDIPWLASDLIVPFKVYILCFALHVAATAGGLVGGIIFAKSKLLFVGLIVMAVFMLPYAMYYSSTYESVTMTSTVEYNNVPTATNELSFNYFLVSCELLIVACLLYSLAVWIRNRQEVA